MTVAELKAILDTLPDDTRVYVDHEPSGAHEAPALFASPGFDVPTGLGIQRVPPFLTIISPISRSFIKAQERTHWKQLAPQQKESARYDRCRTKGNP